MALSTLRSSLGRHEPGAEPPTRDRALWRGSRANAWAALRLARVHVVSAWQMLLAVGLGILMAATLLAIVPIYSALIGNVQLQTLLNTELPLQRNVEVQIPAHALAPASAAQRDQIVRPEGGRYLSSFTQPAVTAYLSSEEMLLGQIAHPGQPPADVLGDLIVFDAFDYAQAGSHMQLVAGRFPQPGASAPLEGMVTQEMAQSVGIQLGDVLTIAQRGNPAVKVSTRVVGIWTPLQADDPYWDGLTFASARSDQAEFDEVLVDQSALLQVLAAAPSIEERQHWVYYTRSRTITTGNIGHVAQQVGALRTQLVNSLGTEVSGAEVLSGLEATASMVRQQLSLLALPLYVVVVQILGLSLLFVTTMAGLLVEGERPQIAQLKSRGISGGQLVASYALVGVLLSACMAAAGPWIARAIAVLLVNTVVPADTLRAAQVGSAYLASLVQPSAAIVPVALGAALGLIAVVVGVWRASRTDIVALRREAARPRRAPLWRRYFIDVQLAVLCLVAYADLSSFGGLNVRAPLASGSISASSGSAASLAPLLAPGLLLLAGALLLLRVFPYATTLGTRVAARLRGAVGVLAFAHVERSPTGPARLTLLLALAVGVGGFALTVDASLTRNASDRASYEVGADVRLMENLPEAGVVDGRIQSQLRKLPGVLGVTPVYRDHVFTSVEQGGSSVGLLAIDPSSWATAAGETSWRGDYASAPLDSLMRAMSAHQWGTAAEDRAGLTSVGDANHPLWAAVSPEFAQHEHVNVGDTFALSLGHVSASPASFVVGAIVQQFPTMYEADSLNGYVVVDVNDYIGTLAGFYAVPQDAGPNEYWLKTSADPRTEQAFAAALADQSSDLDVARVLDRRADLTGIASSPLQSGVRGLLLAGAVIAAALAVLGSIIQSLLAARQRELEFAVLRTLGLSGSSLMRMLLSEQAIVYVFGTAAGTVLAAALTFATLPYLAFSDTTVDLAQLGVPPYVVAINAVEVATFCGALLLAFAAALLIVALAARRLGLGQALRIGED